MMSRLEKFFVAVILFELITLGLAWRLRSRVSLLPPIDWNAGLVDSVAAGQIQSLEKRFNPADPASWAKMGAVYRATGYYPQAEYCYRHMDALSPADRSYLYFWAECFSLMGKTTEATRLYRQIIEEKLAVPLGAGTAANCWLNIGEDYLREENVPAATEALLQAAEVPKAKLLLSRLLVHSGRAREAIVLLDELLAKYPDVLHYNQMKSWAEAELGDANAALDFYDRSLRSPKGMERMDRPFDSQVEDLRLEFGGAAWDTNSVRLEAQGHFEEALAYIRKAKDVFWTEYRAIVEARLLLKTGHLKDAIAMAEECERRSGASVATLGISGLAYARMGQFDKARTAFEQGAELEPSSARYFSVVTYSFDIPHQQKYSALAQYMRGKEIWLDDGLTTNGLKRALECFDYATTLWDGDASTWFYIGETRCLLGDATAAEAAYKRCLEINPDHGRALRALNRLNGLAAE